MSKKLLCAFFLTTPFIVLAQTTFTPSTNHGLEAVWNPSASFFDADGDGDLDLYCSGGSPTVIISKLMINDGAGHFTANTQEFIQVYAGKVLSGDLDGDGDNDLFITGVGSDGETQSMLYTNNGLGEFTENTNSTIFAAFLGDARLFDSDGDSDLDLIITGDSSPGEVIQTLLYVNDGTGNFSPAPVNFDSLGFGFASISIGDVDADGDEDVFVCGQSYVALTEGDMLSKLFLNNGDNNFTDSAQEFTGLSGASALSDYDNDNDLDLFIVGTDNVGADLFRLYDNNGSGQFTLSSNNTVNPVATPALKLFDADQDGDEDLFLTGFDLTTEETLFQYLDNQNGTFELVTGQPFLGVWTGAIEVGDVDSDSDLDIYISGALSPVFTTIYINNTLVGIQEPIMDRFIGVSPNPIEHSQLNYTLDGVQLSHDFSIEVKDLLGRSILQQQYPQGSRKNGSIDLSGVPSGTYFLVVKSGQQMYSRKFLIADN